VLAPLAVAGLPWAARRHPVWVVWAGVAVAFLVLWPTKWAQYVLFALPPLAVCAGVGLEELIRLWLRAWLPGAAVPGSQASR
jgi:4-amino-4-deoxy-L-arabinose transferase-like glycosyltransferase